MIDDDASFSTVTVYHFNSCERGVFYRSYHSKNGRHVVMATRRAKWSRQIQRQMMLKPQRYLLLTPNRRKVGPYHHYVKRTTYAINAFRRRRPRCRDVIEI